MKEWLDQNLGFLGFVVIPLGLVLWTAIRFSVDFVIRWRNRQKNQ